MPHLPNAELVAKAWFLGVTGIPPNAVASTLPTSLEAWPDGFLQVAAIPGSSAEMHLLKRRSMLDVTAWAQPKTPGSDKPRWNLAASIAEIAHKACYNDMVIGATGIQRLLTLPAAYYPARVTAVIPEEVARRGEDENSNAAFGFELQMHWITVV